MPDVANLQIKVDSTSTKIAGQELDKLGKKAVDAERGAKRTEQSYGKLERTMGSIHRVLERLTATIEKNERAQRSQQGALDRSTKAIERLTTSVDKEAKAQDRQQRELEQTSRALTQTTVSTDRTTAAVEKKERAVMKATASGERMKRMLLGLVAGFSLLFVIRDVTSVMAGFEETMAIVRGVAIRTNITLAEQESQFVRLRDTARDLGATTRYSAREAGEGILFLARAGFDADEAIAAIPATLALAQAGVLGLGEAADYASNIVSQFGLRAAETERVVDTLINTANRSNTDVRQLAEALKFAGPVAGSLGIAVEETAAAIGALGDSGIQASLAGTNLRGVMAALEAPTAGARRRIEALGLSVEQLQPSQNDLATITERLAEVNLTAGDAFTIFGRRIAGSALILTNSSEKIRELTQANIEARGEALRLARLQDDTLAGSFKNLRSAVEELFLKTGDQGLTGGLRGLVGVATDVIRIFAGVDDGLSQSNDTALAFTDSVKLVATAAGVLVAINLGAKLLAWAQGFTTLTAAATSLNATLLANPYLAAAAAVGVLTVALIKARPEVVSLDEELRDAGDAVAQLQGAGKRIGEIQAAIARAAEEEDLNRQLSKTRDLLVELETAADKVKFTIQEKGEDALIDPRELKGLAPTLFEQAIAPGIEAMRNALQAGFDEGSFRGLRDSVTQAVSDLPVRFRIKQEDVVETQDKLAELYGEFSEAAQAASVEVRPEVGAARFDEALGRFKTRSTEVVEDLIRAAEIPPQAAEAALAAIESRIDEVRSKVDELQKSAIDEKNGGLTETEVERRIAEAEAIEEAKAALDELISNVQTEVAFRKLVLDNLDEEESRLQAIFTAQQLLTTAKVEDTEESKKKTETIALLEEELDTLEDLVEKERLLREERARTSAAKQSIESLIEATKAQNQELQDQIDLMRAATTEERIAVLARDAERIAQEGQVEGAKELIDALKEELKVREELDEKLQKTREDTRPTRDDGKDDSPRDTRRRGSTFEDQISDLEARLTLTSRLRAVAEEFTETTKTEIDLQRALAVARDVDNRSRQLSEEATKGQKNALEALVDQLKREEEALAASESMKARATAIDRELEILTRLQTERGFTPELIEAEADAAARFGAGTAEATEYVEMMRKKLEELEDARQFDRMADDMAGAFTNAFAAIITGAGDLEDVFKGLALQLSNIILQEFALEPLKQALKTLISSLATSGFSFGGGSARGNVFDGGRTVPFAAGAVLSGGEAFSLGASRARGSRTVEAFAAGGLVSSPTYFPLSGKRVGLMGEAGPEAILPASRAPGTGFKVAGILGGSEVGVDLRRSADGRLGVDLESVIERMERRQLAAAGVVPSAQGNVFDGGMPVAVAGSAPSSSTSSTNTSSSESITFPGMQITINASNQQEFKHSQRQMADDLQRSLRDSLRNRRT